MANGPEPKYEVPNWLLNMPWSIIMLFLAWELNDLDDLELYTPNSFDQISQEETYERLRWAELRLANLLKDDPGPNWNQEHIQKAQAWIGQYLDNIENYYLSKKPEEQYRAVAGPRGHRK